MAKSRTTAEQRRRWRERNLEKVREYQRGWNKRNRVKLNAYNKEYRKRPEVKERLKHYVWKNKRKWNASSRYGITGEQFEEISKLLDVGPCEICGKAGKVHIDHDHKSGKFRGLLCGSCNRAIGLLKDSPEVTEAATYYLRSRT